ncbi:hypothetical protein EG68_04006 [Paragonimus skrjabini miyazakii]|uniref:Uncharacterized protein n=1 Tax=Paragonimus skrjabini miyazakii TaxID=59628 RepID=A0A8S9YZL7_9TREM|nr:hypothetical protein EG68_04006 [Paragonimus skrjabini miyazakii]
MQHQCATKETLTVDELIVAHVRRVLDCIRMSKSQLGCFHEFFNLGPLRQEMKLLINLFRVELAKSNISFPNIKCGRKSTNSDCLSSMTVQEALSQVLLTNPLPATPKVYLTTRTPTVEVSKNHSKNMYGRAKLHIPDPNTSVPDVIQLPPTPSSIRSDITLAARYFCLLESLMKLVHTTHLQAKSPNPTETPKAADPISVSLARIHQARRVLNRLSRRVLNRLCEVVDRINSRRHVDRILINLRRRSTAKSLMFMIDQERHKKSPWRI